ncbi:unnamed protein product [Caenorhabditis angaria]|uniref:Actin interacting protein 3-like C-terminal domain-containing protein n=1 Tax=Caenorhabditis angaria TaxID=860376 RepID=A0A9P1IIS1_9PELO|nr:unnamed protein product [Caenorhabditis angaria]
MFGCIAPPKQNRNLMRSSSQDSRDFHGDPRFDRLFQRPSSVLSKPRNENLIFSTPPIPPQSKSPKVKRLDKWIGNLLNEGERQKSLCWKIPPRGTQFPTRQEFLKFIRMPLFSWRPRLLLGGRKTPEPTQAVQITIAPEPPILPERQPSPPKSARVRFDDSPTAYQTHPTEPSPPEFSNSYGGEARVLGVMRPAGTMPSTSHRPPQINNNHHGYAEDVRINIAPLASTDIDADMRPPQRFVAAPPSRATSVLQSLREQKETLEYDERRRQASTLPTSFDRADSFTTDDTYSTRHLDDMNVVFLQANDEVKRTILPPAIHSMHQVKMAFVRTFPNVTRSFVEQPHVKIYIQEPTKGALFYELEDPGDIKNKSVLRLREKSRIMSPIGFQPYDREPDYHSETEQDDGRRFVSLARPASAMAAPVHHLDFGTLPKKMAPPQMYTDAYGDPYNSDTSSHDSRSVTRSGSATPIIDRESRVRMETMERQLAGLSTLVHTALVSKGMSQSTQRDMAELRKEVNAQTANTLIREAGEKIEKIVTDRVRSGQKVMYVAPVKAESNSEDGGQLETQRNEHASRLAELLNDLTNFETNVENVRGSVLSNQKKLRMSEVEDLTGKLTDIGRLAANLKTDFPPIQSAIETRIKRDMERVVREEKFIRDQTSAVDQSLRRCKALANIMVTMKKLAMVQDPTIQRTKKKTSVESPRLPPKPNQAIQMPPPMVQHIPPPPPPPPMEIAAAYMPNVQTPKSPILELDGILEEVSSQQPPRPPSRYSVQDVRQKFSHPPELPDQIKTLIEDVARRASPAPDTNLETKRQDLEERQERLAEKQRQLRSQFQQLQQLAPQ